MDNWIQLDTDSLTGPQSRVIRGVQVTVFPPPDDIPEALRGGYDREIDRFAIEFRYIGERHESLIESRDESHPDVILRIGRHSRRLYRIEIDVKNLKAQQIKLQLAVPRVIDEAVAAVKRLGGISDDSTARSNYMPVNRAIESRKADLVAALTAS